MKTFVFGLTFLIISSQVFAQSSLSGITIHNPVGTLPDGTQGPVPFSEPVSYTTSSGTQFNVNTQLNEPVQFIAPDRSPAQTTPTNNNQPVPYNPQDYWHRPGGEFKQP